jgi:Tfp pilus assembly protein PilF
VTLPRILPIVLYVVAQAALAAPAAAGADARSELAMNAGVRAIQQQDWRGAVSRLEAAIVFDPANADAFERLGYAHQQLGNPDKALKYFRIALEIEPNHVAALSRRGLVLLSSGNVEEAKADLQRLSRRCGAGCAPHDELQRALDSQRK